MKWITVLAETRPKRKFLGFVEGGRYVFRVAVRNSGDEPVVAGHPGDLEKLEFTWEFPNRQVNGAAFRFPGRIEPGQTIGLPPAEHKVLAPGFALLFLRIWRIGEAPGLAVSTPGASVRMLFSSDTEYAPEFGAIRYGVKLPTAIHAFRAKSRGEVLQLVLLGIAIFGLFLNTVL